MAETIDHPVETEKYQPLSLLALAGFGLAIIYSLAVIVGGAVALLARIPWLMAYWTFLLPLAALVLCKAAATRIHNSEGTLSGLVFTTWGSRLAILVSLTYAAYYLATFFAVRGPAIDCANDFFQKIKQGHLDQAFLKSQEVSTKGMSSDEIREILESRFNKPSGRQGEPGYYTRFRQERFVRFIEMDGDKANITPTGVSSWEYNKDGYRVVLTYHVATTLADFDLKVETFGRDSKPGEPKGRQWQIVLLRGETAIIPDSLKPTPRGLDLIQKTEKALRFASNWVAKASDTDTLTPAEREQYSRLIRLDDKTFWAGKNQRADIIKLVRNTFSPSNAGKKLSFNMNVQPVALTLVRDNDGRTTAWVDVTLRYFEGNIMMPQYVVQGQLVVSADKAAAAESSSAWRVDALEIESGRTLQNIMPRSPEPPSAPPVPR
jgi:hypothetical protein